MEKTIREIYGCIPCALGTSPTLLEKWYNALLEKQPDEITISDVLRMLRQNELVELAIAKAISLLCEDPFCGWYYDGELLLCLSKVETAKIYPYLFDINAILQKATNQLYVRDWMSIEDRVEMEELIIAFTAKLATY